MFYDLIFRLYDLLALQDCKWDKYYTSVSANCMFIYVYMYMQTRRPLMLIAHLCLIKGLLIVHSGFEISNWMYLSVGQVDCKNHLSECTIHFSEMY